MQTEVNPRFANSALWFRAGNTWQNDAAHEASLSGKPKRKWTTASASHRTHEAGRLLTKDALDMLTSWFRPAQEGLDSASSETSDGVDDALAALLKDEVPYVVEFLSDKQFPGPVCRAFWQSELYLRDFQQVAGQAPLEEFTQSAKHATGAVEDMLQDGSDMPQALDRLVTRQQFAAAVRFGYFLRRAKQRLRLESIMWPGCF